jgi:hypothetical protein
MKNGNNVKDKPLTKKDFWQGYRACILEQGVPEASAEWYVTWAENLARSQKGLPLKERTAEHVRAFLSNLKNQVNVKEWQVDQANEFSRLSPFFCDPSPGRWL